MDAVLITRNNSFPIFILADFSETFLKISKCHCVEFQAQGDYASIYQLLQYNTFQVTQKSSV
jgi:hypothetical protein